MIKNSIFTERPRMTASETCRNNSPKIKRTFAFTNKVHLQEIIFNRDFIANANSF